MTELEQIVAARDVKIGDRIVLPKLGDRRVLEANESTFGLEQTPCIRIVYALGASQAWHGGQRGRGPESCVQPEAGLRPLLHDDPVRIAARTAA